MYWNFEGILRTSRDVRLGEGSTPPLIVEIGFGNGEYLEHLAATRPDALVVGVEVSQWCLTKAARRVLAAGFDNVRLLHGDARYLLTYAFEPASISEIHMNFPCPWPKKRHEERRVTTPLFARVIASSLVTGGSFTLATDVDWYAEETKRVFGNDGHFRAGPVLLNPPRDIATKYERKWAEQGRDTYVFRAEKEGACDRVLAFEEKDEGEDASVEMTGLCDAGAFRERLAAIEGDALREAHYRVTFRKVFFAEDGTALITAISVDEGFEQHYYIKVVPSGEVARGKIDSIGHPYRTPGVRASLKHVMNRAGVVF